jgi:hypothetical protein
VSRSGSYLTLYIAPRSHLNLYSVRRDAGRSSRVEERTERTESTAVKCAIPPLPARAHTACASCNSDNTQESNNGPNKPKELKHFKMSHARYIREIAERQREQREQVEVRAAAEKAGRARLAERVLKHMREALQVGQSFDAFLHSDLPPVRRLTSNWKLTATLTDQERNHVIDCIQHARRLTGAMATRTQHPEQAKLASSIATLHNKAAAPARRPCGSPTKSIARVLPHALPVLAPTTSAVVVSRDNLMAHYGAGHDDATAAANYALWRRNNGVHKNRKVYRYAPSTAPTSYMATSVTSQAWPTIERVDGAAHKVCRNRQRPLHCRGEHALGHSVLLVCDSMTGGYDDLRRALNARGWVENRDRDSYCWDLLFTLKTSEIRHKELRRDQVVNHFLHANHLTTKIGLMHSLHELMCVPPLALDVHITVVMQSGATT